MYIRIVPKEYLQYLRKSSVWRAFWFGLVVSMVHQLFCAILYHFTFMLWHTIKAASVPILISLHAKIRCLTFLKIKCTLH